jgi:hypothetical protein
MTCGQATPIFVTPDLWFVGQAPHVISGVTKFAAAENELTLQLLWPVSVAKPLSSWQARCLLGGDTPTLKSPICWTSNEKWVYPNMYQSISNLEEVERGRNVRNYISITPRITFTWARSMPKVLACLSTKCAVVRDWTWDWDSHSTCCRE